MWGWALILSEVLSSFSSWQTKRRLLPFDCFDNGSKTFSFTKLSILNSNSLTRLFCIILSGNPQVHLPQRVQYKSIENWEADKFRFLRVELSVCSLPDRLVPTINLRSRSHRFDHVNSSSFYENNVVILQQGWPTGHVAVNVTPWTSLK